MRIRTFFILIIAMAGMIGCAGRDVFPSIGANMANPITLAVDSTRARLYVINSNYRVFYDTGSIHVVDITNPQSPVRVGYAELPDFSGEIYLDTVDQLLYTTNRMSNSDNDVYDNMFRINVDESSADFLGRTDYSADDDPYGIVCCDASNRILVAAEAGFMDYYDLNNSLAHASLNLTTALSSGVTLSGNGTTRIVILGTRAVISNVSWGLLIVNLDQVGVSGTYPVDYYIPGVDLPQGIATDGTYIYAVDNEYPGGVRTPTLVKLDIRSLPQRTGNATTDVIDKDASGLVAASVALGDDDPRELLVSGGVAYVSHFGGDIVSLFETAALTKVTDDIPVGDEPFGMAVYSPAGTPTHLFVANSGEGAGGNSVSVIDLATTPPAVVGTYQ